MGIGATLSHLARMHLLNSRFDKALSVQQDALKHLKEIDEKHEIATCLTLGAEIMWRKKDSEAAMDLGTEALELAREIKDTDAETYAIEMLSILYKEQEALAAPVAAITNYAADEGGGGEATGTSMTSAKGPYSGPGPSELRPKVMDLALQSLGDEDVSADTPLMEAGLDSLAMVAFRSTLMGTFPGVPMPASLIFDHPSVDSISIYVAEELKMLHENS